MDVMAGTPDARRGATAGTQQVQVGEGAGGVTVRGGLVLMFGYVEIHVIHVIHGDEAG